MWTSDISEQPRRGRTPLFSHLPLRVGQSEPGGFSSFPCLGYHALSAWAASTLEGSGWPLGGCTTLYTENLHAGFLSPRTVVAVLSNERSIRAFFRMLDQGSKMDL